MFVNQLIDQGKAEKIAIIDKNQTTYGELQKLVRQYRNFFYFKGIRKGDNVGLYYKNSLEFVCTYMAIVSLGSVIVPLNLQLTAREIAYIVQNAKMKALVTFTRLSLDQELSKYECSQNLVQLILPEIQDSLHDTDIPDAPANDQIDVDDVCTIIYTSGTTGYPKGAMLTHNNLVSNAAAFSKPLCITENDHALCVLPMFHCFAWTTAVLNVLYSGATVTVLENFNIRETMAVIRTNKITVFYGIPTMYKFFATWGNKEDFQSVRAFVSGGSSLLESIYKAFKEKTGKDVHEGYGLSEASPVVSVNPFGNIKTGSIGTSLPGVHIKIVDEEDVPVSIGKIGELLVSGANVMKGYYSMPEESKVTLRDGWLHTGDLAYQDQDGYIYIVDRLKDMIITSGENIYPREIEEVLCLYPHVAEAAVVGIPDELRGHSARAYVVATEEHEINKKVLKEYLQMNLAAYKVPREIKIVESLPKNSTGKILKKVLREQAVECIAESVG